MELYPPATQANADQIDPGRTYTACEGCNVKSFGGVHRIDRVTGTCDGPHFDGYSNIAVPDDEIYLAVPERHVAPLDDEAPAGQPLRGDRLPGRTDIDAAIPQRLSSVFSSFSTFTSRNVRTCTFSRNRAGRNMSQTQASVMVTSK